MSQIAHVFCLVCLGLLLCGRASAQPNSWTNSASGNWEDASWSLGLLPSQFNDISVTNENSKVVTISSNTAQNFPASMSINRLALSAPDGQTNTLFFNSTGTNIFQTGQTVTIASNGVLTMVDSRVIFRRDVNTKGVISQVGGYITFHDSGYYSSIDGRFTMTNGIADLYSPQIGDKGSGSIEQVGGTNQANLLIIGTGTNQSGSYTLHSGVLKASSSPVSAYVGFNGIGGFTQLNGTITMNGTLQFGWGAAASGNYLLQSGALSNASLNLANQGSGLFIQNGGSNFVGTSLSLSPANVNSSAKYVLNDGYLQTFETSVKAPAFSSNPNVYFIQNGGTHKIGGTFFLVASTFHTAYTFVGGTLNIGGVAISGTGSAYIQSGGTANVVGTISAGGFTDLAGHRTTSGISGGSLSCSDLSFSAADFGISGGTMTISNTMSVSGGATSFTGPPFYGASAIGISGGSLSVNNIDAAGVFYITGPTPNMINHSGYFRLAKFLSVSSANESLGRLRVNSVWGFPNKLFFAGATNRLAFADSSGETWTTTLYIDGWKGSFTGGGAHQLFIGTNANGLTAAQLDQIKFVNLPGLSGTNNARILSTGEIVPFYQSTIYPSAMAGNLVLSWSNAVSLQTSTNVAGPYVDVSTTSPYTNNSTEAQRFFRLRQ